MIPLHPDLLVAADLPVEFGRYTLLKILGEGAMARVFEAELRSEGGFRKRAAVKVIHATVADKSLKLRESLYREAQMGGLLHHPNVVETYDFGETGGHPWIAMEVVDGVRLDQLLLQYGRLPPHVVLEVGIQVCAGLAHAHSLVVDGRAVTLIHRDLKPPNVMISREGQVKVMDFGIAKATHMSGDSTEAGHTKGTPAYMSPEQCTAAVLDGRSDLFAVGALLFEMAAGHPFFEGESVYEVMAGVLQVEDRLRLAGILDEADAWVPGLGQVVRRCLRSDRELRYASAVELDRSLRAIQAAHPATFPLRTWLRQVLDDPTDEMAWTDMASSIYDQPPPVREAPTAWQAATDDSVLPAMGDLSGSMGVGELSGPMRVGELSGPMGVGELSGPMGGAEPVGPPGVAEPSAPHVAPQPSAPHVAPQPSAPRVASPPPPAAAAPYLRPEPAPVHRPPPARDRPTSPMVVFGISLFGFSVLALALVTFFVWDFDGRGGEDPQPLPVVQGEPAPKGSVATPRPGPSKTPRGRSKADVPVPGSPSPSPTASPTARRPTPPAAREPTPTTARSTPAVAPDRTPAPTPRIVATATPAPVATPAPEVPRAHLVHQPPAAALLGSPNPLSFRLEPSSALCEPVLFHASWPPGPEGYDSQRLSPAGGGAWEAELFIPYAPEYRNGFRYRVSCVSADGAELAAWPSGGSTHAVPALAR